MMCQFSALFGNAALTPCPSPKGRGEIFKTRSEPDDDFYFFPSRRCSWKNWLRIRAHGSAITPATISARWFSRGSSSRRYSVCDGAGLGIGRAVDERGDAGPGRWPRHTSGKAPA